MNEYYLYLTSLIVLIIATVHNSISFKFLKMENLIFFVFPFFIFKSNKKQTQFLFSHFWSWSTFITWICKSEFVKGFGNPIQCHLSAYISQNRSVILIKQYADLWRAIYKFSIVSTVIPSKLRYYIHITTKNYRLFFHCLLPLIHFHNNDHLCEDKVF